MKYFKKGMLPRLSLFFIFVVACFLTMTKSFDTPVILSEKGATWIYINRPFNVSAQFTGERISYRTHFFVDHVPSPAIMTIRALRISEVYIDGQPIPPIKSDLLRWKGTQVVNLRGFLSPGMHEVMIRVFNENGPAALLASCEALNLLSGPSWEVSQNELSWTQAVPADKKKDSSLAEHFSSTDEALVALFPIYLPLFLIVFSLTLLTITPWYMKHTLIRRFIPTASGWRWMVLVAWVILAINNILKVPPYVGMDVVYHIEYIGYIFTKHQLPFSNEGLQMFQSPLYYIISAFLYVPLSHLFDSSTSSLLLRIIPLICGILQVELGYRTARYVFPQRQDLQVWGTIIAGLLPMNLYMSQVVGNEPLAGLFSASAVVIGFHILTAESGVIPEKYFILLGTALGLSLLTKVTAILLIPLSTILMIYAMHQRQNSRSYIITRMIFVSGIIVAIAGWYYIRNWIELGRPFIGSWEYTTWWQDPGFRTISDFFSFGRSLSAPIYSAVHGFWDSLYSTLWLDGSLSGIVVYGRQPPWNYDFMISGALLSLVPTAGFLIGILVTIISLVNQPNRPQIFAVCCIGVYIAALLYMYITLPIYSTAKATYTLGLIPCFMILSVTGLGFLSKNNLSRAIINACLACWAVAAYCSYFVL
jgi:hypothetical protein